jgi:hypothetical protein
MNMKRTVIGAIVMFLTILSFQLEVLAQERPAAKQRSGKLAVGADLGLQAGTADDDTALALGFNADYYLDEHFSLGPLLQFGFTGDLTQIGMSAQAKYMFDMPRIPELKPHLQGGLGFLHIDMDCPPACTEDSDLGFLVPFGGGFELQLDRNLLLGTTLLLNFTDADVIAGERVENLFMTWFFGFRIIL